MDQQTLQGSQTTVGVKEEQCDNESQRITPVIMSKNTINLEITGDQILCICPHQFWFWVLDPLSELLQHEHPPPNGAVQAVSFESPCTVLVLLLQSGVSSSTPPTGSYHWFCVPASMWYVVREVARFQNLCLSGLKATHFHPSYDAVEGTWDDIAASTEVQLIQQAPIDSGCNDFLGNVLAHCMVTTFPEPSYTCESGEPVARRLYRLWLEWQERDGNISLPLCITSSGSNGGFALKKEVQEEELCVSQCNDTEQESTVPTEPGSGALLSTCDFKEESILVCPVSCQSESPSTSSTNGKPSAPKGCKKTKGFHEFFQVCKNYTAVFKPREDPCISPFRKFHFGGPRSMVECPACSMLFKGNASDMLDLCNHIKRCHREAKAILLECVIETYQDKIDYRKKKIRDHASKMYRRRLRCNAIKAD